MGDLSKKVQYLKGLADGMGLKEDTQEHRLLLKMLEVLDAVATEMAELQDSQDEINEYLENIDEDLALLEDVVFEEDDFELEGEYEDEEGDSIIEYECPHCGYMTRFDITDFDFDEDYLCPQCQQPFFPEHEEDEDEDEDHDKPQG